MKRIVKDKIVSLLQEDSREAALEYLLGWVIGLNANGNTMTEDDVDFVFYVLNQPRPNTDLN
jgi:hypothetical protein